MLWRGEGGAEGVMVLLVMDVKGLKWDVIRTAKLCTLTSHEQRWSGRRGRGRREETWVFQSMLS